MHLVLVVTEHVCICVPVLKLAVARLVIHDFVPFATIVLP